MTADWLPTPSSLARDPGRLVIALFAVVAGVAVFVLSIDLFPHHSSNHDEGVYLQQAAMLLDGSIAMHAGDLAEAVRPWFFVQDGGRLYPKYAPVPAAMYAVTMGLVGEPRVTLALVAAGNVALVGVLGTQVFDRRVGVLAAGVFAAAPMNLITSAVFLPYAPTTLLHLAFAVAYLRAHRTGSTAAAGIAGVAIGLAFFARPFTAVLFAAPFVAHAILGSVRQLRHEGLLPVPETARRTAVTVVFGLAFVGVTLAYNTVLTGSPLLFPFQAFAPLDGIGFGQRRILGHAVEYTPSLAVEANARLLWEFATRWFTAGAIGTTLALAGLAVGLVRWARAPDTSGFVPVLAGLFVTIPAGNLLFWGNYNVLGALSDPADGLIAQFGPFYHFDLLVPLAIFAGLAIVAAWRALRTGLAQRAVAPRTARIALAAAVVAGLLVAGAANAAALGPPVHENAAFTEKYETVYEPFDERDLEDALVFVPTPYGDWLNHPFQRLRNGPDLSGDVVYAMGRGTENVEVLSAYPERTPHRFTYRGEWNAAPDTRVEPHLQALDVRTGERLHARTTVGVPDRVSQATVRLEGSGEAVRYRVADPESSLSVGWSLDRDGARLHPDENGAAAGSTSVGFDDEDRVELFVRLIQPDGSTLTYREAVTVRRTGDGVEAVWPPERTVCPLVDRCGTRGTFFAGVEDEYPDGVTMESTLRAESRG